MYDALNELKESQLDHIYDEYGTKDNDFRPVNLLRAECVKFLLEGNTLTSDKVNEIKELIRSKNTDAFLHYPEVYRKQIKDYRIGKRDIFANWQNQWSIFHTFIYRGKIRETIQQYLEQISVQLLKDLNIKDYTFHWVDFTGANNFGSEICWLALYPEIKNSHKDSYQFIFVFSHMPIAGRAYGSNILKPVKNKQAEIASYEEGLKIMITLKDEILKLNKIYKIN